MQQQAEQAVVTAGSNGDWSDLQDAETTLKEQYLTLARQTAERNMTRYQTQLQENLARIQEEQKNQEQLYQATLADMRQQMVDEEKRQQQELANRLQHLSAEEQRIRAEHASQEREIAIIL